MQSLEGKFEVTELKRDSEGCLSSRDDKVIVKEMAEEIADSMKIG
jgi:hypothetical protein